MSIIGNYQSLEFLFHLKYKFYQWSLYSWKFTLMHVCTFRMNSHVYNDTVNLNAGKFDLKKLDR